MVFLFWGEKVLNAQLLLHPDQILYISYWADHLWNYLFAWTRPHNNQTLATHNYGHLWTKAFNYVIHYLMDNILRITASTRLSKPSEDDTVDVCNSFTISAKGRSNSVAPFIHCTSPCVISEGTLLLVRLETSYTFEKNEFTSGEFHSFTYFGLLRPLNCRRRTKSFRSCS